MPLWKRVANRFLTTIENLAMGREFSECHTGYRAYSRRFLETVPFLRNSNGFVFDTEVIFQAVHFDLPVVEVPIASRYFDDASSVGFRQGVVYGLGTLWTAARFLLHRWGLVPCDKFKAVAAPSRTSRLPSQLPGDVHVGHRDRLLRGDERADRRRLPVRLQPVHLVAGSLARRSAWSGRRRGRAPCRSRRSS